MNRIKEIGQAWTTKPFLEAIPFELLQAGPPYLGPTNKPPNGPMGGDPHL